MFLLKQGVISVLVKQLQRLLNSTLKPSPSLTEDGDFGQFTKDAVIRFQKAKSLTADGVVGPQTWSALGMKISVPQASPLAHSALAHSASANSTKNWMQIARDEFGVQNNSLPGEEEKRIIEYHQTTTLKATTDETAWCSSFVNWVMTKAGYAGTNDALAKSWLNWGSGLTTPREGAICVIKKKAVGSDQATGSSTGFHVAFFVSSTSTHVRLFGGNQAKKVCNWNVDLTKYDVKGYRWPTLASNNLVPQLNNLC